MFKHRGNYILKGATIKGNNKIPIGSIFLLLKVAPMRIDNNFKGHEIEKLPKLNYANICFLKSPNFDAVKINTYKPSILFVGHRQTV